MNVRRSVDRRMFLAGTAGAMAGSFFSRLPLEAMVEQGAPPPVQGWDAGLIRHLLPTVSESRILLKVSFDRPLSAAPTLRVDSTEVTGRMNDTLGEYWQFYAADLEPDRRYSLSLVGGNGRSLCEPWDLSTFPSPNARPERFRVLFLLVLEAPVERMKALGGGLDSYRPRFGIGCCDVHCRSSRMRRSRMAITSTGIFTPGSGQPR